MFYPVRMGRGRRGEEEKKLLLSLSPLLPSLTAKEYGSSSNEAHPIEQILHHICEARRVVFQYQLASQVARVASQSLGGCSFR